MNHPLFPRHPYSPLTPIVATSKRQVSTSFRSPPTPGRPPCPHHLHQVYEVSPPLRPAVSSSSITPRGLGPPVIRQLAIPVQEQVCMLRGQQHPPVETGAGAEAQQYVKHMLEERCVRRYVVAFTQCVCGCMHVGPDACCSAARRSHIVCLIPSCPLPCCMLQL